jgi:hypothetical protein
MKPESASLSPRTRSFPFESAFHPFVHEADHQNGEKYDHRHEPEKAYLMQYYIGGEKV